MSEASKSSSGIFLKMPREQIENLMRFDEALRKTKQIGFLTPEARVLLMIALKGAPPVSDALAASGASYRSFFTVLSRLKKAELVQAVVDSEDHRVRRLSIEKDIKNDLCG